MTPFANVSNLSIFMLLLLLLAAFISAFLYWRRARKLDAILVLCVVLPIIAVMLQLQSRDEHKNNSDKILTIDSRKPLPPIIELRAQIQQSNAISLQGDGLFASQWQDLPVKTLQWQRDTIPVDEVLQLNFSQQLQYGRVFQLEIKRSVAKAIGKGAWRLQLLAENQQVLAEKKATENQLSINVSWLPPVAERMVLQARVLNDKDQIIDQGPIPLNVIAMPPLQVQGRFSAPSFDIQTLNTLLTQSDAVLDWQTQLGKGIVRKENARSKIESPNVFIQDAAYFEQLNTIARRQLLDQVAAGASLIILGANAQQSQIWSTTVGLNLRKQTNQPNQPTSQSDANEVITEQGVRLNASSWTPVTSATSIWRSNAESDLTTNLTAQRDWQQGKILWLAVSNWHQAMISEPQNLKFWWQSVLDASEVKNEQEWEYDVFRFGQTMSLPGQKIAVCSRGLEQRLIQVLPDNMRLQMQPAANRVDAHCAAFWPLIAGWHHWQTTPEKNAVQAQGSFYIFKETDWPTWQRHQKHLATEIYAQKLPEVSIKQSQKFPTWPFILLSMSLFLLLWWREQRG